MDLVLWRHAEAEDLGADGIDMDRALTARGEKQARRMARWLDRQLPETTRVLVSPARRTEQTASALERKYRLCEELSPDRLGALTLLELAQWPQARNTVLVVGHQPLLGQTVAQLLGLREPDCAIKKGAVWWLRARQRDGEWQTVIQTVQSPDML